MAHLRRPGDFRRQAVGACANERTQPRHAALALNQLLVFEDLHGFLDELQSYSRELDEMGEPTEKIEAKETFHLLDAVRYVISYLHMDKPKGGFSGSPVARRGLQNL